jgi:recombination protein RecA
MKIKPKKKTSEKSSPSLAIAMRETIRTTKGVDTLFLGDDFTPLLVKSVLPTGLSNLDRILSVSEDGEWGLPVGRIISVKAKPSVGKTTFLLTIAKQALERGGAVHFIESEHALDLKYAREICPFVDQFFITQPDTLEQAFDAVDVAVNMCLKTRLRLKTDAPFLIILDSFSGFSPERELEGDFSSSGKALGEHARIASMACRKLTGPLSKAKAILILSHQTKSKIGVFWGSNETNIGGDAFNYHNSICLNLYRTQAIKDSKKVIIGHYGSFKTTKNKLFPPHREVKFKIINGKGFSRPFSILDFLITNHEVIKSGGWFHFKRNKELRWQGIDNFNSFLKENKKARKLVKELIK